MRLKELQTLPLEKLQSLMESEGQLKGSLAKFYNGLDGEKLRQQYINTLDGWYNGDDYYQEMVDNELSFS